MKSSKGLFIASIILFLLSILNFNVCLTTKGIVGIDRTELHYYDGPAYSHQQQSRSIEDAGYNEERTMHPGDLIKKGSFQCPTPLVPFYDVIPEKSNTTTTTLSTSTIIPRTLFVSMKSRCLPQDYYEILQRWQQMLPNYAIRFYDDDDVDAFLFDQQQQTTFPHLKEALRCIQFKGAMIIDVWRMLILYQYGGVYTDIDNWPLDKFSEGLWTNINDESNNNTNLTAFFFSDSAFRPTQWFMAMEPRHPIAYFALLNIQNNLYNLKNLANPDIITVTGPNTLRDAFYQFIYSEGGYESMAQTGRFSKNLRGGEGYFTGMHQMRIRKLGTFSREEYITSKRGWEDIVVVRHNATTQQNVTRAERVKLESGVIHWQRLLYLKNKKNGRSYDSSLYRGSCMTYLKSQIPEEIKQRDSFLSNSTEHGPPIGNRKEARKRRRFERRIVK